VSAQEGWTALHRAAEYGKLWCSRLLLEKGADANAKNAVRACVAHAWAAALRRPLRRAVRVQAGATPLHTAAEWNQLELVTLLLENGASKEATNNVRPNAAAAPVRAADAAPPFRRMAKRRSKWRATTRSARFSEQRRARLHRALDATALDATTAARLNMPQDGLFTCGPRFSG